MSNNNSDLLKQLLPDAAAAFESLQNAVFKDGALTLKVKELIAIGVAVAMGCNDCMDYHTALVKGLDATDEEIAEAMSVGFEMGIGRLYPPMMRSMSKNLSEDSEGTS